MAALHVFNPSHDEALAAATPYYTETRAARSLAESLGALPALWAAEGDYVLLSEAKAVKEAVGLFPHLHFLTSADLARLPAETVARIEPWGWNAAFAHKLRRAGVAERLLPEAERLDKLRTLSSRQTAVKLLQRLRADLPFATGESLWCETADAARRAVAEWGRVMVKTPWSSSGRGVFCVEAAVAPALWQRVERILREQGAVELEPRYERMADFAMEFYADGRGGVVYEGLSVFQTNAAGAYLGNIVCTEAAAAQFLPAIPEKELAATRKACAHYLAELLGKDYEGPLGVDMMAVRTPVGGLALHPCVEVNLRRTMGHVALALRARLEAGAPALYQILPQGAALPAGGQSLLPQRGAFAAVLAPLSAEGNPQK